MDPKGMIDRVNKEDYYALLHTKLVQDLCCFSIVRIWKLISLCLAQFIMRITNTMYATHKI